MINLFCFNNSLKKTNSLECIWNNSLQIRKNIILVRNELMFNVSAWVCEKYRYNRSTLK